VPARAQPTVSIAGYNLEKERINMKNSAETKEGRGEDKSIRTEYQENSPGDGTCRKITQEA
jgi:hypothetical protein